MSQAATSLDEIIRLGLSDEERNRLGIPHPGEEREYVLTKSSR